MIYFINLLIIHLLVTVGKAVVISDGRPIWNYFAVTCMCLLCKDGGWVGGGEGGGGSSSGP